MNPMNTALIGGIVGGVVGILGGVIGTYFSIKNTRGQRKRNSMIKCCAVCWIALTLFLGLMFTLPTSMRHFLWIPYAILFPIGLNLMNRRVGEARRIEEAEQSVDGNPH